MYRQNLCYNFQYLFRQIIRQEIKKGNHYPLRLISTNSERHQREESSSDFIQLKLPKHETEIRANKIWLRHHCRCPKCFNRTTYQRTQIPSSSLKDNSKIREIRVEQDLLRIVWEDDHVSTYECQWLQKKIQQENLQSEFHHHDEEGREGEKLKNDRSIVVPTDPLSKGIKYEDFMCSNNKGLTQFLRNLKEFGYGVIIDAPSNVEDTNKAILRVSHPQTTIFGDFYEFSADGMTHADTAYTSDYIHLHTDTTYFSEPVGLQIFHCLSHDGEGGLNSIVDGYKVAKEIQEENPQVYQVLTQSLVPWQYVDPQKYSFYQIAPILSHHPFTKQLECIRYNPHDMAILNTVRGDQLSQFYDSLIILSNKIENSPVWMKLNPGVILFLDNWRMLHGRNTFTGRRKMCGSYISRSDWLSKCRVLL